MDSLWWGLLLWLGSAYGLIRLVTRLFAASRSAPADMPEEDLISAEISMEFGLSKLTLGLATAEVAELLGPALYVSQLPQSVEAWRYPLGVVDEQGFPSDGVLVLSFQRGRLIKKALEHEVRVIPESAEPLADAAVT